MLNVFARACTPPEGAAVGMEWEKEAVHRDGRRVTFPEEGGIQDALKAISASGWTPHYEGPHMVGLDKAGSSITLEPGAQMEVATPPGAPSPT